MAKKSVLTDMPTDRLKRIYMNAIADAPAPVLDPPATPEEIAVYKEMCKDMREKEAKAKREGRTLIWDMPFDYD